MLETVTDDRHACHEVTSFLEYKAVLLQRGDVIDALAGLLEYLA